MSVPVEAIHIVDKRRVLCFDKLKCNYSVLHRVLSKIRHDEILYICSKIIYGLN